MPAGYLTVIIDLRIAVVSLLGNIDHHAQRACSAEQRPSPDAGLVPGLCKWSAEIIKHSVLFGRDQPSFLLKGQELLLHLFPNHLFRLGVGHLAVTHSLNHTLTEISEVLYLLRVRGHHM